jgi:hypothetical protein
MNHLLNPASPLLFHSLLNQRSNSGDVFQEVRGNAVALLKVFR